MDIKIARTIGAEIIQYDCLNCDSLFQILKKNHIYPARNVCIKCEDAEDYKAWNGDSVEQSMIPQILLGVSIEKLQEFFQKDIKIVYVNEK